MAEAAGAAPRPVTFLSDYGLADEFVGVCHAVIARIAPEARIVDLTHGVPRHDVSHGAAILARSLPYAVPGVHLAVVDPGVGTARRGVALRTRGRERFLVGPDNGLLLGAAERFGGVAEALDVSRSPVRLEPVSASFHGRDVFAPVAATLARGVELEGLGEPIDPASLVRLEAPPAPAEAEPGRIRAHVASIDAFGNVALDLSAEVLDATGARLGGTLLLEVPGRSLEVPFASTFADAGAGEPLVHADSWGTVAVAVNRGDAARELGLSVGDPVGLGPAGHA